MKKPLLITLVIAIAVAELLYRLGITSYGAYNSLNAISEFINIIFNIR